MSSDQPAVVAPGLKAIPNAGGSVRYYWRPNPEALALDYPQKTVRLVDTPGLSEEEQKAARRSRCANLQAEMNAWLALKRGAAQSVRRLGTLSALIIEYRSRESSPYKRIKWNTRKTYDQYLDLLDDGCGTWTLAKTTIDDIVRVFNAARYPDGVGKGKPDRLRKAHGIVTLLRRAVSFGVAIEFPGCIRLNAILENYRFEAPRARTEALEIGHVTAFISAARADGRLSLAIGTALQFETTLRQKDVIGEWEPIGEDGASSAHIIGARQWVNGLTWSHISKSWTLTKSTTKSARSRQVKVVTFDLTLMPLAYELLRTVPDEHRFGPLIIDEFAKRPYAEHGYHREWRKIADKAGIPRGLWNMDARAGGLTESDDAGASLDDARRTAGHSDGRTTARYIRGEALAPTRRVATLRVAHRERKDKAG